MYVKRVKLKIQTNAEKSMRNNRLQNGMCPITSSEDYEMPETESVQKS